MKKMIPLVLLTAAFLAGSRAAACSITDKDKASIENASQKTFTSASLPTEGEDYTNMCLSRALVHLAEQAKENNRNPVDLAGGLSRKDVPTGMSRFVTSDEYSMVRRLVLTILARSSYPGNETSKAT